MPRLLTFVVFTFILFGVVPMPLPAAAAINVHRCVDTTVFEVQPRLVSQGQTHFTRADFASGVEVAFHTTLGVNAAGWASVVHYQGTSGNTLMMSERPGDRVRVCLVSIPTRDRYCNPVTDLRGRVYNVWDYRRNAWYTGMNSEHDCGGA
ncbi:MAG TPA: hypothetical protein VIN40_01245 [Candidatus Tyrphobacter sp.]